MLIAGPGLTVDRHERSVRDATYAPPGLGGRILVAGADADAVAQVLRRDGCDAVVARSGIEARSLIFRGSDFEVVIADRDLPDLDGRELCRELRAADGPPVVLIGGLGEAELVESLQIGAEDYLARPFGNAELLARVQAVLRRSRLGSRQPAAMRTIGPLVIDPATRRVTVDGKRIELTPRQYVVLLALAAEPPRVVTREEIFLQAWGPGWLGSTKALDMQISALRRKLGETPDSPRFIHTVRGVGFLLAPPD